MRGRTRPPAVDAATTVNAEDNWYGCNDGPGAPGCETVFAVNAPIDADPWLVFGATGPSVVDGPNGTAIITADMLADSDGVPVAPVALFGVSDAPVTWSAPLPSPATGAGTDVLSGGTSTTQYNSQSAPAGPGSITATLDNQSVTVSFNLRLRPVVTDDPADTAVDIGSTATFAAAATGDSPMGVQWQVSTNGGGSFTDIPGAESTTLSFAAALADDANQYRAVFTNVVDTDTSAAATLTVGEEAEFTSADTTSFTVGSAGSFTVTVDDHGAASTAITKTGTLPDGLTFTDNGDGTATISGTPVLGSADSYPVDLEADNGIGAPDTQTLTITVREAGVSFPVPTVVVAEFEAPIVYGQEVLATATVSGAGAGSVQFSVDDTDVGSPVALAGGSATSPDLAPEPGTHVVTATYLPGAVGAVSGSGSRTLVVSKATTTVVPSVKRYTVRAVVAAGTGEVAFSVDDVPVGTAPVVDGVARLKYVVEPGMTHEIVASYSGDSRFEPTTGSVTRADPNFTYALTSPHPITEFGWYRAPVLITYTCEASTAPLVHPCPAPKRIRKDGYARRVANTIWATDGGSAWVAFGVNIDKRDPRLRVRTTPAGRLRCIAHDPLSGIDFCRITRSESRYRAVAVDKAGNRTVLRGRLPH